MGKKANETAAFEHGPFVKALSSKDDLEERIDLLHSTMFAYPPHDLEVKLGREPTNEVTLDKGTFANLMAFAMAGMQEVQRRLAAIRESN